MKKSGVKTAALRRKGHGCPLFHAPMKMVQDVPFSSMLTYFSKQVKKE